MFPILFLKILMISPVTNEGPKMTHRFWENFDDLNRSPRRVKNVSYIIFNFFEKLRNLLRCQPCGLKMSLKFCNFFVASREGCFPFCPEILQNTQWLCLHLRVFHSERCRIWTRDHWDSNMGPKIWIIWIGAPPVTHECLLGALEPVLHLALLQVLGQALTHNY